jgi:homoserine O-acetyltransferase
MKNIRTIDLHNFNLEKGKQQELISLSYQIVGKPLGSAPVIVVNHSLTGNSNVSGRNGWWNGVIGDNKSINTAVYTIITFNIPGNGYNENEDDLITNYRDFTIRDIAAIFWEGLFCLKVNSLFAVIGEGLGGSIAWEMAALQPKGIENLIPIATDWKTTDRILATVLLQEQLLTNSEDPIIDARYYANLYYKNPDYINQLFKRSNFDTNSIEIIEKCILEKNQFKIKGYRMMNYLMKSNDLTRNRIDFSSVLKTITASIYCIGIDTEGIFSTEENRNTALKLIKIKSNVFYKEFKSEFGFDAYLKEDETISAILQPIFKTKSIRIQNQFSYTQVNYPIFT